MKQIFSLGPDSDTFDRLLDRLRRKGGRHCTRRASSLRRPDSPGVLRSGNARRPGADTGCVLRPEGEPAAGRSARMRPWPSPWPTPGCRRATPITSKRDRQRQTASRSTTSSSRRTTATTTLRWPWPTDASWGRTTRWTRSGWTPWAAPPSRRRRPLPSWPARSPAPARRT